MRNFDLIINLDCILGEGPCWDEIENVLYWIDILGNRIHCWYAGSGRTKSIATPENIGCLALTKSGGMIATLQDGFYLVDFDEEVFDKIADPEPELPNNRFNDGKCDFAGRFWAGTMSKTLDSGEGPLIPNGSLYSLSSTWDITRIFGDITISNGITWNPANDTMYFIDTPTRKIAAFDFDNSMGQVANKRFIVDIPESLGSPDGMCVDSEGKLWVALWGGSCVCRCDPDRGEILSTIELPVQFITSCVFGGEDFQDLFVTSASMGAESNPDGTKSLAGGVFRIPTGIRGLPLYRFG